MLCGNQNECFVAKLEGKERYIFSTFKTLIYKHKKQISYFLSMCGGMRTHAAEVKNQANQRRRCRVFYCLLVGKDTVQICQKSVTHTLNVTFQRLNILF